MNLLPKAFSLLISMAIQRSLTPNISGSSKSLSTEPQSLIITATSMNLGPSSSGIQQIRRTYLPQWSPLIITKSPLSRVGLGYLGVTDLGSRLLIVLQTLWQIQRQPSTLAIVTCWSLLPDTILSSNLARHDDRRTCCGGSSCNLAMELAAGRGNQEKNAGFKMKGPRRVFEPVGLSE